MVMPRPLPPTNGPPKSEPPALPVEDDMMLPPTEAPPETPSNRSSQGENGSATSTPNGSPPASLVTRPARSLPTLASGQDTSNSEAQGEPALPATGPPPRPTTQPSFPRPAPPPIADLPSPDAEDDTTAASPTSDDGGFDSCPTSPTGNEEVKAGRRTPSSRAPALTKTLRTNNLPHQRANSQNNDTLSSRPMPQGPPPGSLPRPPTGVIEPESTLTAEDFAWNGQRSVSLSTIPVSGHETSQDASAARPNAPRSFALSSATQPSFAKRSGSVATRDGAAQLFRSQSQPTGLQGGANGLSNPRDSAAIVLKLGIQTMAEETPDMMKQRANLADEILKTEAVYLEDLRLIVSKFLIPFRMNMKIMSATDGGKLFLNIESLELISEEIHGAMKEAFEQAQSSAQVSLASVYLQYTETMLQGFSLYCAGHSDSLSLLTRLKKKQAGFTTFLEQLEADESLNRLRLADFLTRPIQHICRQPLLLRELLKATPQSHPDYEDLIFALDQINDLVDRVNSNAKEVGNIQSITNVESIVAMLPEGLKLLMPGRYMLREARFLRHSGKTGKAPAERYLFLFSDMLILTKPKPFSDTEYVFTELLPLHQVHIEEAAETEEIKNAFSVTSLLTLRSHIFVAKDERKNNEVIKRDWLSAISTTKARFERGLAGASTDDETLGIAFKVQSGASTGYDNPYEAMRDQMASVSVQQRITGWRGEAVLREIWNSQSGRSPESFTMPFIVKFHTEAPAAIRVTSSDDSETIENEAAVFVFGAFLVIVTEKKDVQVKKPYDWIESVIYDSCVLANSDAPIQEAKIQSGRTVYPLTLISASTRKKFVLYFRSDTVKSNMYAILSSKMPAFLDNGAAIGASISVSANAKKDKSSGADGDDKGTLRTKKNIFGRKLGYRTVSTTTNASDGSDGSGKGNAGHNSAPGSTTAVGMSPEARKERTQSSSVAAIIATQGTPTPFLASSSSAGNLHSPSIASNMEVDDDNEPEKLLTADGFEVPPWAPDDSSNVCLGCQAKFTATNRRHHCRNCGQLFCKKCTTKKCFLPRFGFTQKKMKVCERCFLKH